MSIDCLFTKYHPLSSPSFILFLRLTSYSDADAALRWSSLRGFMAQFCDLRDLAHKTSPVYITYIKGPLLKLGSSSSKRCQIPRNYGVL